MHFHFHVPNNFDVKTKFGGYLTVMAIIRKQDFENFGHSTGCHNSIEASPEFRVHTKLFGTIKGINMTNLISCTCWVFKIQKSKNISIRTIITRSYITRMLPASVILEKLAALARFTSLNVKISCSSLAVSVKIAGTEMKRN